MIKRERWELEFYEKRGDRIDHILINQRMAEKYLGKSIIFKKKIPKSVKHYTGNKPYEIISATWRQFTIIKDNGERHHLCCKQQNIIWEVIDVKK